MTKWFVNSGGLPEDKLHNSPEVRAENFLPLRLIRWLAIRPYGIIGFEPDPCYPAGSRIYNLRQGATRKSSRCRREIEAKHPVTTR
jgi:hypothetical protein